MKKTAKPSKNWLEDITLVGCLCEMESARINEVPKHKVSLYRDGLHYNVINQHENKVYLCEISNNQKGEGAINEHLAVGYGFKASLLEERHDDL